MSEQAMSPYGLPAADTQAGQSGDTQASSTRSVGHGIVVAGDRTDEYARGAKWTRWVLRLRKALPIAAGFMLALYLGVSLFGQPGDDGLPSIAIRNILPTDLVMNNPTYEGFGKDGSSFVFKAKTAKQSLQNTDQVLLKTITGHITQLNKTKTNVYAASGVFNHAKNILTLEKDIRVKGEQGLEAQLTQATLLTQENILTSNEPSTISFPGGSVTGKNLTLRQKAKEITFVENVVAKFTQQADEKNKNKAANQTGAAQPGLFQANGEPVRVTANRLDVNDNTQLAIFRGKVIATQGDTRLETTELEAKYGGNGLMGGDQQAPNASQTGPNAGQPAGSGQLEKIISRYRTTIYRGTDETIIGDNAEFDAKENFATLRGNIEILRGENERVTGDVVQFDSAANVAVLTGNVIIRRGNDEQITSKVAEFSSTENKALLRGDVVIVSGNDRRITSDVAFYDSPAQTALLTGNVVMTQGPNVLRGGRLSIDQGQGTAQLTTPPSNGEGPGRITASFVQNTPGSKPKPTTPRAPAAPGEFGFKTDPNAPVNITADQMDFDDVASTIVFSGDVNAKQGDFTISSRELIARYKGNAGLKQVGAPDEQTDETKKTEAAADVTDIEAKHEVTVTSTRGQTATGDWAKFNRKTNKVTMGGNVVLAQGENLVRGTRLIIDMATGKSTIDTAPPQTAATPAGGGWTTISPDKDGQVISSSGRASAVFFPRNFKADETPEPKQPQQTGPAQAPSSTSSWGTTLSTTP